MTGGAVTRVVIAEDHTLVRDSLIRLLCAEPDLEVVAASGRGDDALDLILAHDPDIALLDIGMPGLDGLTLGMELRRRHCLVPIVYLTMYRDRATVRTATQLGARGYVLKDDEPADLLLALRTVAAGGRHVSPAVSDLAGRPSTDERGAGADDSPSLLIDLVTAESDDRVAAAVEQFSRGGIVASPAECAAALAVLRTRQARREDRLAPFQRLSRRESEVLAGLLEGWNTEMIAEAAFVSVATVRTQIRSLMQKLGVHSQLAAVAAARRAGWTPGSLIVTE